MSKEALHKLHKRMLVVWAGPGLTVSVLLALFASTKVVLIWNLVLSIYTVLMEHFIGARQEQE